MSRWYPMLDTHFRAVKATKMGVFGALGFAAWLGIPAVIALDRVRTGIISPIEFVIVVLLVAFALFTALRFHRQHGWIVGPILMVVLVIEVGKRLFMPFDGVISIGVFDLVVTFMMFFGIWNGVRGGRALRLLTPNDDLEEVFL